jgi:hypothetical protein
MKSIIVIASLIISLSSCDFVDDYIGIDREKFVATYTDILVVRETYPDTTVANKIVRDIYSKHDYTEEQFRDEYFELFQDDKDEFLELIDSARSLAKQKILNKTRKDAKKESENEKQED